MHWSYCSLVLNPRFDFLWWHYKNMQPNMILQFCQILQFPILTISKGLVLYLIITYVNIYRFLQSHNSFKTESIHGITEDINNVLAFHWMKSKYCSLYFYILFSCNRGRLGVRGMGWGRGWGDVGAQNDIVFFVAECMATQPYTCVST